jgi:hypothetical protein
MLEIVEGRCVRDAMQFISGSPVDRQHDLDRRADHGPCRPRPDHSQCRPPAAQQRFLAKATAPKSDVC